MPKNGFKTIPSKYRRIHTFQSLVRLSIVNSNIMKYSQSSTERPTANLLTFVTHSRGASLEFHGESQLIVFISKAFYTSLFHKVPRCGISPELCAWVSGFLCKINIASCEWTFIFFRFNQCQVSQESVLNRTLFLLNINHLLCTTYNFIHSYAGSTMHAYFPQTTFQS